MKQKNIYLGREIHRIIHTAIILIVALICLSSMVLPKKAEAVTIVPNDTGIAQGSLVNRPEIQDSVLKSTKESGAKWIRLDLYWDQIENTQGVYDWKKFDDLFEKAHAPAPVGYGLNILVIANHAPLWAVGTCGKVTCPPDNAHIANWTAFLRAAANRYSDPKYGITTYEIWNEPNLPKYFSPAANPKLYFTNVLKPGYEGVKSVLPNATVITGGTAPSYTIPLEGKMAPWQFIKELYAADVNAKNYFDHIGHHPYTWPDGPTAGNATWNAFKQMDEEIPGQPYPSSMRNVMDSYGDSAAQIWATEIGLPTEGCIRNGVELCTETQQSTKLKEIYNEWSKKPWGGKIFWYSMRDDPNEGTGAAGAFGLKRSNNTAKSAYDIFYKIVSERYAYEMLNQPNSDPNAKHYWKLGELSSNTAVNVTNSAANGIYTTGITRGTDNVAVGTPAPEFNADGESVNVTYNDEFIRLAWDAWTVEFSARRIDGSISWPGIIGRGDPKTANGWAIYEHRDGGGFLSFKRNNVECRTATTPLADAAIDYPHHFAVTYYQNEIIWYVDGVRVNTLGTCNVAFPAPSTAAATLKIGASGETYGRNAVGHVAIWNYRLSSSRVKTHADAAIRLP